jgi:hypothetical protein
MLADSLVQAVSNYQLRAVAKTRCKEMPPFD